MNLLQSKKKHNYVPLSFVFLHFGMIKIFSCSQVREIDRYTIENEPVSSVDLMERAAGKLFGWISARHSRSESFTIFTGPGNNGGDGLVLARLMHHAGYRVRVFHLGFTEKVSPEWKVNHDRLLEAGDLSVSIVMSKDDLPMMHEDEIIIDAIFGSGLARPADGLAAHTISHINRSGNKVISVDIPSGLFGENNSGNNPETIIRASSTLTFQFPKLAFMFADNHIYTGEWYILPIGLHAEAERRLPTPYMMPEKEDVASLIKKRGKFDHKGNYGHGLLMAGSRDKAGAAILAARAALRTGIGLITCHVPSEACTVIQASLPEAMIHPDKDPSEISEAFYADNFSAAGAGPGIGTSEKTSQALKSLLALTGKPPVLDADALNIFGLNKNWLKGLPHNSILTPHPKEFERIAGKTSGGYERLIRQISFSSEYKCIVVLKGAHTSVSLPDGRVFFNSTGNPGMATAGSGDVLTGIILSLLSQGYEPENAALAGVYIHGLAGDIASEKLPFESIIASDIIDNIGNAFKQLR
jgi:NAD(P)H-hydrate epimerase